MNRRCSKCGASKPLSGFSRAPKGPGGYHSHCKVCRTSYQKLANRAKRAAAHHEPQIWPRENRQKALDIAFSDWPALAPANDLFWRIGA